jgi:hypothetical protein
MPSRSFLASRAVSLPPKCAGSSTAAGSKHALCRTLGLGFLAVRCTETEFRNDSGAPIGSSLVLLLTRTRRRTVAALHRPVLNGWSWSYIGPPSRELFNDWYW